MKNFFNFKCSHILVGLMIGSIFVTSCEKEVEVITEDTSSFEKTLETFKEDYNLIDEDQIALNGVNYTVGDINSYDVLRALYDMTENAVRTKVTELEEGVFLYHFYDTVEEEDLLDVETTKDSNPRLRVLFFDNRGNRNKTNFLYKNQTIQFTRHKFKSFSANLIIGGNDIVTFQANIGGRRFGMHRKKNSKVCGNTYNWSFVFKKHNRRTVFMKAKNWYCKY